MNMKTHHWMLTLLCGTLFATSSLAEELPWYEVEIIIFTRNLQPASLNEAWPTNPGRPDVDNARPLQRGSANEIHPIAGRSGDLPTSPQPPEPYALLLEKDLKLKTEFNRLQRSRSLKPEIHLAWRQPVTDKNRSRLLYLRTPFSAITAKTKTEQEVEAEIAAEAATDTNIFTGFKSITTAEPPNLEGTIRISVKRYLHVELDLLRHIAPPSFMPYEQSFDDTLTEQSQTDNSYRMQAHRRMRSNELHYIDHPLMGVLIKITPYELPKPIPVKPEKPEAVEPLNQTAAKQESTAVPQKPGTIRSSMDIPAKPAE